MRDSWWTNCHWSRFSLLIIIPTLLYVLALPSQDVRDRCDQAAHYHILSLEVWDFIYDPVLGSSQSKEVKLKSKLE
jgi:hypothetical protein